MDNKYIDLLIKRCMNLENKKSVLINYSMEISDFVDKLINEIKKYGIEDIYLDKYDNEEIHDFLKNHSIEEIKKSSLFNSSIWDEYAERNASFLIIETEYPGVMDDIDDEKIGLSSKLKRESRPLYRKMVEKCELDWCIAAYPGELWAKSIFPNVSNSYELLKNKIFKMCMLDEEDPLGAWDNHLEKQNKVINYLNSLNLEKLVYSNSLGTNLTIYLPEKYLYSSAKDRNVIVNMPSYEVFTSPDWRKTEGIVYSSKSLTYNGAIVDDFWIKFRNGKVVEYDAKRGREILKSIIESDDRSCYLGECALVEKTSPIAIEDIVFGTTLIDENASCHLALGAGFPECIRDGIKLTDKELIETGINVSKNHVDFMIGTDDLKIKGITRDGRNIFVFEEGKFSQDLLNNIR